MGKRLFVLLLIPFLGALRAAHAYDDNDFQLWNAESEEFSINKDTKFVLEEEFRWGDNAREFYYQHYDAGFFYKPDKHWILGGGYRHIYELKRGKFKQEAAPYLTLAYLDVLAGFAIEDRNRVEYREFAYQSDQARYRNKLTVKFPWKFTAAQLQPYISDEVFFSFGGFNGFNRNRVSSGVTMKIGTNVKAELYYMLQSTKSSGRWSDANVLGTKLKFAF